MNRKHLSTLLPLLALLAGCGGKYHASSSNSAGNSFAGDYTGTYQAPFLDDSGTLNLVVSSSGAISGTGQSNNVGAGTATGSLTSEGTFSGTLAFNNGTSATLNGPVARQTNGSVTGTLTEVYQGQTGSVTVTLTPVVL